MSIKVPDTFVCAGEHCHAGLRTVNRYLDSSGDAFRFRFEPMRQVAPRSRLAKRPATWSTRDKTPQLLAQVDHDLLEPVNQPPSVGIFADDLPARTMLRLRAINHLFEFDPQSSGYAGRQDIGRAAVNPKTKNKR
jgi:hypothetical protein